MFAQLRQSDITTLVGACLLSFDHALQTCKHSRNIALSIHVTAMKRYFLAKLSDLNFRMAIHEGDANRRLVSEIDKLLLLRGAPIPERHKPLFNKLSEAD